MLLTSLRRLRNYIGGPANSLTDNNANNRELSMWLASVSSRIESYIGRQIKIESRTEYYDATYNRTKFFVKAIPISTITSVKEDSSAEWDDPTTLTAGDDYNIGPNSRCVILTNPRDYVAPKAIQIVYTGGMAYHAVNSTFAYTGLQGTIAASNYLKGATSGAVGIVNTAPASGSIVVENIYGVFEDDERVDKTSTEGGDADGTNYFTIDSLTRQSLAEKYPEIVTACEMEIRFMWKNKMDFENAGVNKDNVSRNIVPGTKMNPYNLRPETMAMLSSYRRPAIVQG